MLTRVRFPRDSCERGTACGFVVMKLTWALNLSAYRVAQSRAWQQSAGYAMTFLLRLVALSVCVASFSGLECRLAIQQHLTMRHGGFWCAGWCSVGAASTPGVLPQATGPQAGSTVNVQLRRRAARQRKWQGKRPELKAEFCLHPMLLCLNLDSVKLNRCRCEVHCVAPVPSSHPVWTA